MAIHHIVPRTLCETPTDVYLLNRYNNLMPLTLSENCNQSHSIVPSQLNEWHHSNERIQKIQPNSNCENIAKRNIAKTKTNNKEDKNKRIGN